MKHLLVIQFGVPPTPGPSPGRCTHLARHLPAHGWEAIVLTPRHPARRVAVETTREHRSYRLPLRRIHDPRGMEYWLQETGYRDVLFPLRSILPSVEEQALPGLYGKQDIDPEIVALDILPDLARGLDRLRYGWRCRPDARAGWILPGLQAARAVCEALPPQAVYSISPPVSAHRVAMRVAANLKIPWIADLREPWGGSGVPWLEGLDRARILRRARVVDLAPSFDGADLPDATAAPHEPPRVPFVVTHAGSTRRNGRDVTILLDALRHVLDTKIARPEAIRLRFVGARDPELLGKVAARHLAASVVIEAHVPWDVALDRQHDAGALAILLGPGDRGRTPDRLLEAWSLRRPYLTIGAAPARYPDSAALAGALADCLRGGTPPFAGEDELAPHRAERVVARIVQEIERRG